MADNPYLGGKNPYQAPTADGSRGDPVKRKELKEIAQAQRIVIFSILGYLVSIVAAGIIGNSETGAAVAGVFILVVALVAFVASVLLAYRLWGLVAAIVCALLMLIPFVSLVVLLVLSNRANARLKDAGIEVGFLGASSSQF